MSEIQEKAGKLKVKRPKKLVQKDEPIKIDLSKKEETIEQQDAIQVGETKELPDDKPSGDIPKVEIKGGEPDQESAPVVEAQKEQKEESPIIEEIIEEPEKEEPEPEPKVEEVVAPEPVKKKRVLKKKK